MNLASLQKSTRLVNTTHDVARPDANHGEGSGARQTADRNGRSDVCNRHVAGNRNPVFRHLRVCCPDTAATRHRDDRRKPERRSRGKCAKLSRAGMKRCVAQNMPAKPSLAAAGKYAKPRRLRPEGEKDWPISRSANAYLFARAAQRRSVAGFHTLARWCPCVLCQPHSLSALLTVIRTNLLAGE